MRNKVAKRLKKDVLSKLYADTKHIETKSGRRMLLEEKDFKQMYRARKKNYTKGIVSAKIKAELS